MCNEKCVKHSFTIKSDMFNESFCIFVINYNKNAYQNILIYFTKNLTFESNI